MALLNNKSTKEKWIEQIFNDYPDLKTDTLKHHYIENMIDAYLADEKTFKKMTYELKSKGDEPKLTKVPDEVVCIGKVEAEEQTPTIVEEVEADN
jgi:hypothetical protein